MSLRSKVAASPLARLAAMPVRTSAVARHLGTQTGLAAGWLATSREHHNYTYDLTPRNIEHLSWWVATVTGAPAADCRVWVKEVNEDRLLHEHVTQMTRTSRRRGLADTQVRIGRRAGWYAIVRALRPDHVVETGTDKGLGSVVLAAALLRNGKGQLTTMDVNPAAGYLVSDSYAEVTSVVIGDSLHGLSTSVSNVGVFIHDSDHTSRHETAELEAVAPNLAPGARILSDNSHETDSLVAWAGITNRRFLYFQEEPCGHWYRGAGIGASW